MCCCPVVRVAGLFAALLLCVPGVCRAGLLIVSQSVEVRADRQDASFTLTFDHVPEFGRRDALGRPTESFQYEIAPNCSDIDQCPFTAIRAVVRGDEITGSLLPIRDGIENGSDPNPASGGWGYVRGDVPFQLRGNSLTFAAPLSLLQAPDGQFAYRVFTTSLGETDSLVTGQSIPLPAAVWSGGLLLIGLGLASWALRRQE